MTKQTQERAALVAQAVAQITFDCVKGCADYLDAYVPGGPVLCPRCEPKAIAALAALTAGASAGGPVDTSKTIVFRRNGDDRIEVDRAGIGVIVRIADYKDRAQFVLTFAEAAEIGALLSATSHAGASAGAGDALGLPALAQAHAAASSICGTEDLVELLINFGRAVLAAPVKP